MSISPAWLPEGIFSWIAQCAARGEAQLHTDSSGLLAIVTEGITARAALGIVDGVPAFGLPPQLVQAFSTVTWSQVRFDGGHLVFDSTPLPGLAPPNQLSIAFPIDPRLCEAIRPPLEGNRLLLLCEIEPDAASHGAPTLAVGAVAQQVPVLMIMQALLPEEPLSR